MKYRIAKTFQKESQRIRDPKVLSKLRKAIEVIAQAETLNDIPNLEALQGFPGYYRLKFDYHYRIGLYWDGTQIDLLKVGSREGFYKQFP